MRSAEASFSACIMSSSSIRLESTGRQVGWTTKTSAPRTFSRIWMWFSPSANWFTLASASGRPRDAQISWVSAGLAFPVKILMRSWVIARIGFGAAMFSDRYVR